MVVFCCPKQGGGDQLVHGITGHALPGELFVALEIR